MPVKPDSTVTVYFYGLLAFCFDDYRKICQIGIHTGTDDHSLRITVIRKFPMPLELSTIRVSHQSIRESGHLLIDACGDGCEGAERFESYSFDPLQDDSDPQDFRWILDFEGEPFYPDGVKITHPEVLTPSIYFNHGLFYTAKRTELPYRRFPKKNPKDRLPIGKVAQLMGANLYLANQDTVTLRLGDPPATELFSFTYDAGTTYEVWLDNSEGETATVGHRLDGDTRATVPRAHVDDMEATVPSAHVEDMKVPALPKPKPNHMRHYYEAVELKEGQDTFLIEPDTPDENHDDPPCITATFGKHTSLYSDAGALNRRRH